MAKKSQIGEQALLENRTEEAEIRKAEKKKKKKRLDVRLMLCVFALFDWAVVKIL